MINKIIIVKHVFEKTSASVQRLTAEANEFQRLGCEVVLIISHKDYIDEVPGGFRFIQLPYSSKDVVFSSLRFIKAIKKESTPNSAVLLIGAPLYGCLIQKKYNVFVEDTEIPLFGLHASLIKRIYTYISNLTLLKAKGVMLISNNLIEFWRDHGIKNMEQINMFVDTTRFEGLEKKSTEKYVGYCGFISVHKDGVNDLIYAFSLFSIKHPDYKLMIIGPFQNDYVRDTLISLVKRMRLENRVIFTGAITPAQMPQLLYDAEILALARPNNLQAKYGFPTKLGEYLATGNPVCVTKVGDIPHFLHDGINAFMAEPDNPKSFANALCRVADDIENAKKIGLEGKKLVYKEFSSKIQAEKALSFINKLSCL